MINYSLICNKDHKFEAWFRSYDDYENQIKSGLLNCPVCGGNEIAKALMAPAVQTSKNKDRTKLQKTVESEKLVKDKNLTKISANSEQVRLALKMIKNYVEKNCENVGENFAVEARKISKGETRVRDIYGKASRKETEELQDEGIEIAAIPWIPDDA